MVRLAMNKNGLVLALCIAISNSNNYEHDWWIFDRRWALVTLVKLIIVYYADLLRVYAIISSCVAIGCRTGNSDRL